MFGGGPILTSPTSVLLSADQAVATAEFLDSSVEGMYYQASTSAPANLGDIVTIGISSVGNTYVYYFEIASSGYQVWAEGMALGTLTSFTSPALFSIYSDATIVYFMVDGVMVQNTKITASSYQAYAACGFLITPPHSVTNLRFYPTGKLGQAGDTGPAGPDSYTPANAGWWDTSSPTSMTDAIDRLAYYFFTLTGVGVPLLP